MSRSINANNAVCAEGSDPVSTPLRVFRARRYSVLRNRSNESPCAAMTRRSALKSRLHASGVINAPSSLLVAAHVRPCATSLRSPSIPAAHTPSQSARESIAGAAPT